MSSPNSAHSCYGTGAAGCVAVEKPYSYDGLDLKDLQTKRQERVDALLQSGPAMVPAVMPTDLLEQSCQQQQIERYRQLQNDIGRTESPKTGLASRSADPRLDALDALSRQLREEHAQ